MSMDEPRFWALIEDAWQMAGADGRLEARRALADGTPDDDPEEMAEALAEAMDETVIATLRARLLELPAEELLAFDRVLERKLYDLDRADIQEITDGSDDGFLYCRGFIVGLGWAYYEAVRRDPERAVPDAECEALCYLPQAIYREKFGEPPASPDGISRETGSNRKGWEA